MRRLVPSNFSEGGPVFTMNLVKDMEAFDTLPKPLRDALNNATTRWSAYQVRDVLQQGYPLHIVVDAILKQRG